MESGLVAIALLVALGGIFGLLIKQGLLPVSLPAWRLPGARDQGASAAKPPLPAHNDALEALAAGRRPRQLEPDTTDASPLVGDAVAGRDVAPWRSQEAVGDGPLTTRLAAIERRLDDLARATEARQREFDANFSRVLMALEARTAVDGAREEAGWERLRADLMAAVAITPPAQEQAPDRHRAEACSELYARLARLEWAMAAVTNPALLPGEAYGPPQELPPAALVWENWNDVGERAFALADGFSVQRLHLSVETAAELRAFITSLRMLLTRSIYPNLRPDANVAQLATLQAALGEIAAELPRIRDTIESEFRQATSR